MPEKPLHILNICNRVVYPPNDGGTISALAAANGLAEQGCEVTIFALNPDKHYVDVQTLPPEFTQRFHLKTYNVNTDVTTLGAIANLFSPHSYHTIRFNIDEYRAQLIQLLQEQHFDIVHIEGVHMAWYIPEIRKHSTARIILRAPNVEHQLWESTANSQTNILKKWYLSIQVERYKKFEIHALQHVDAVVGLSPEDVQFFAQYVPKERCHCAPTPVDTSAYQEQHIHRNANTVFHLGDLGWQQNLLAVEWFLQHVWPLVHKHTPQLRFSIAGRNIPQTINAHNVPNVDVIGDVPSAAQFMLANNIMVVPLFAGGGIRIKIIEGMAAGNCIVTTPLGAQGLGVTHKQQLLIAQTPQEFAEAIVHYANNPESARHITENARKFTQDNFEANTIAKAYTEFYRHIASMPPR